MIGAVGSSFVEIGSLTMANDEVVGKGLFRMPISETSLARVRVELVNESARGFALVLKSVIVVYGSEDAS